MIKKSSNEFNCHIKLCLCLFSQKKTCFLGRENVNETKMLLSVSVENRNRHTLSRFFIPRNPTQSPSTEYDVQWKVSEGGDGGMAGIGDDYEYIGMQSWFLRVKYIYSLFVYLHGI